MHDHRLENGRAWKAYTFAAIFLLPAFTATMFADVLLRPRLEANWEHAGLHNSRAEWLFRLPDVFISEGRLIVAAVVISFLCLELFWKEWPKYRLGALALATFLLNAAALCYLAVLCKTSPPNALTRRPASLAQMRRSQTAATL